MGAEQSRKDDAEKSEKYERMMRHALEQQRKAYEEKCKELVRMQQKTAESKENIEGNLQTTKAALEKQRAMYEEKYKKLMEEQSRKLATQAPNQQNVFQNTTVNAVPLGNNAPLYPNLPQLSTAVMEPSTSSVNYGAHSSSTHNQHKSIFEPSAPTAPIAPVASSTSHQKRMHGRVKPKPKPNNEIYQCPSCKVNRLGGNIFQCEEGHSSCSQCKVNAVKCGICKSSITNTRNIDLEAVIGKLYNVKIAERVNCPNKSDGCSLTFKPENMQSHLKECIFREMECPIASAKYSACSWRGKINQLTAHFREYHPDQTGSNVDTEMCFNLDFKNYTIHHITMGNFNFLVHVKLDENLQTLFMTVQLIGSLMSATKWTYEFHVYEKSEPRKKFTYTDACLPTSMPFSEIANDAKCAALPLRYAMCFFKNNKLNYKFYIKREESKKGPNQRRFNRDHSVQVENRNHV